MDDPLSFRILFESSTNVIIEDLPNGYQIMDCHSPRYEKRHKPNSDTIIPRVPNYNIVHLQSGIVLYFFEEDGKGILAPEWVIWNPCTRKIIQRLPRSITKRLRYLSYFMGEEEGYDSNHIMIYEYLEDDVYYAYLIEMRLRRAMRNVLSRWRCYHIDKKKHDEIDPITLCEPEKPIVLYSWKAKRKFVFDAKSIAIHIETQLLHQNDGFTSPLMPRNPWSNVEFTYIEMVSLYLQIKKYGELRWGLCTLHDCKFDKMNWFQMHQQALIVKALKQSIYTIQSSHIREMIEDFIITMLNEIGVVITNYHRTIYHLGLIHLHDHWYIQKWKQICIKYYDFIRYQIEPHFSIVHNVRNILRKQYYLIHALIKGGYLPPRPIYLA